MADTTSKTIILNSAYPLQTKEALIKSGETVYPGDFIDRHTDGTYKIQANLHGPYIVALENSNLGAEVSTAYTAGETARGYVVKRGDEIYAWVAASASAIVIGDKLVLNGAGGVKKATLQADLTGTMTGTVDGAMADCGGTYSASEVNTNFKELQTALNAILPAYDGRVVATALEAVDNSAGGSRARIRIEIV